MTVKINKYFTDLAERFESEKSRIRNFLPGYVKIEHVGSSAVGIGGKNIVDILVGVKDADEMVRVRDILTKNGYFERNDSHADRIFLATSLEETGEGDFHVHICPVNENSYKDFIILRDYLRRNPKEAEKYFEKKYEFAKLAGFDRKKYKALKSVYVTELLEKARKRILIATTNPGKVMTAKKILARLGYEGLSFADLGLDLEEPEETKLTAEEIAAEKALGYAKQFKDFPVLARDDTNVLVGVEEEDDPKNHNKEFVARKAGKYSDENGEKVFADIAHKYGGELPTRFDWGYAVAWHDGDEIKVVSALATTGTERTKIVDKISPNKVSGFCFAPILKVLIDGEWKYDSELTEEESWKAYWDIQAKTIEGLLKECNSCD